MIEHGRIRTTVAKAKEVRRVADKMVTLGKMGECAVPGRWAAGGADAAGAGDSNARSAAVGYVRTGPAVDKLFGELAARYELRQGGYTRVLRCGWRKGDAAPMAILEFVDRQGEARAAKPAAPMRPAASSAAACGTLPPSKASELLSEASSSERV